MRVYARRLLDLSKTRLVDRLNDDDLTSPDVTQASPERFHASAKTPLSLVERMVSREGIEHVRRGRRPKPTCLKTPPTKTEMR
jgi:hypothetical protein